MITGRPLVAISVAPAHGWNFGDPSADRRQAQAQFEYPSPRWPSRICASLRPLARLPPVVPDRHPRYGAGSSMRSLRFSILARIGDRESGWDRDERCSELKRRKEDLDAGWSKFVTPTCHEIPPRIEKKKTYHQCPPSIQSERGEPDRRGRLDA